MKVNRSGFSLVLSLTIMAAMVMMVIVLASFLQVESRLAQSHAGYLRARFNALASVRVAVGQLQLLAGPDQRVTMRADMYADDSGSPGPLDTDTLPRDANPTAPQGGKLSHQKRYWTGVWATGGIDSTKVRDWNVNDPHESRLFLGWLVSPYAVSTTDNETADEAQLPNILPNRSYFNADGKVANTEGQTLIDGLGVPIAPSSNILVPVVSSGTVTWPTTPTPRLLQEYYGAVDLMPMPLPGPTNTTMKLGPNGRYAFWISDEGIKAKANLSDPYAVASNGDTVTGVTDWEKGFRASAAQRNGIENIMATAPNDPLPPDIKADPFESVSSWSSSFKFRSWLDNDIGTATSWERLLLGKTQGFAGLSLWAMGKQGADVAAGDAMTKATKGIWHDVTTYSFSTLTDTYNGGLKTDLSTAFELPYSVYRGIEVYPGQKDPRSTPADKERRQSLFHNAQGPGDLDFNRPNLIDTLAGNNGQLDVLRASPRSPEWAPRFMKGLFSSAFDKLKYRNGGETPERLGFAYEVPLRRQFFNADRIAANLVNVTTRKSDAYPYSESVAGGATLAPTTAVSGAEEQENLNARIVRGPTWDLYRNYYRLYKREMEATTSANGNALRHHPNPGDAQTIIARGVEPLTFASGIRRNPTRRSTPPSNDPAGIPANGAYPRPDKFYVGNQEVEADRYFYRNNLSDGTAGPDFQAEKRIPMPFSGYIGSPFERTGNARPSYFQFNLTTDSAYDTLPTIINNNGTADSAQTRTTRTTPTSMHIAPTILRYSTVYSVVRNGSKLGITMDPLMVVHNPYDCPIEFEGITCESNMQSSPFRFIFQATVAGYKSTEFMYVDRITGRVDTATGLMTQSQLDAAYIAGNANVKKGSTTFTIGEAQVGNGDNDNRAISFRIVAGDTTAGSSRVIRLEPGEIKIIATAGNGTIGDSSSNKNTFIPADVGFNLSGRAFYKMTPFANVRVRYNNERRDGLGQRVAWTMDFDECLAFSRTTGSNGLPIPFDWTNASQVQSLTDKWNYAKSQRTLHDSFPTWDGSVASLEAMTPTIGQIKVLVRNEGWTSYNGAAVGSEGEIWSGPIGSETQTRFANYIEPRMRNAKIGTGGGQLWNFYLIGKRSIDTGKPLNVARRWFGTPDDSPYFEGSDTVNGFNLVDEPLLLNLQGMVTGWPMYGNSNSDDGYIEANNQEWTKNPPFNASPPYPSYYIRQTATNTSRITSTGTSGFSLPIDPEFGVATGNQIEMTSSKAGTFNQNQLVGTTSAPGYKLVSTSSVPVQIVMFDFLQRAADMTGNTTDWLPTDGASSGFGSGYRPTIDLLRTPDEIKNTPMTPFFVSTRAQQAHFLGYDGKQHAPMGWVATLRGLPDLQGQGLKIEADGSFERSFWGSSVGSANGQTKVVLFPIPRRPLLSLSQLGSVAFAQVNTDPDFTVGSSYAHPGIADLTKITDWPGPKDLTPEENALPATKQKIPELGYVAKAMGPRVVRNRSNVRTDHAFAANLALWDSFFFSGINLQAPSYSMPTDKRNWPSGPDLPIDKDVETAQANALAANGVADATSFVELKKALDAGRNPQANKRLTYFPDNKAANISGFPAPTEFPHPAYLARTSLYNGGFNVNSTSKAAWKAILSGLRGQPMPKQDGTPESSTATSGTVLSRFARAFDTTANGKTSPWNSYRELTDTEIDELAARIVQEVRRRGPFMSLGDFINRRLLPAGGAFESFALKGAIQAAIDNSSINDTAIGKAGGTFSAATANSAPSGATAALDKNSGYYGGFQAASNAAGSSGSGYLRELSAYPKFNANMRFPSIKAMRKPSNYPVAANQLPSYSDDSNIIAGLGAPGIISQIDVLNSIGPSLTARSDTFVVRAYGEALDNAGNAIGKAWVEVVVQRSTEYMVPSGQFPGYEEPTRRRLTYRNNSGSAPNDYDKGPILDTFERAAAPNPPGASDAEKAALIEDQKVNRIFGRRFKATSLRWLSANEI